MKRMLKKVLSLGLALVLISSLLPIGTLVNASSAAERVTYTSVIGPGGYLNYDVVSYEDNKKAGIYGTTTILATTGDETLGENMRAVKWPVSTACGSANITINALSDAETKRKIVVPNTAKRAYFEFDIYTTSAFTPAKLHLGGWTKAGKWPNLTYTNKFSELSANTWHTITLPLDELEISTGYIWTEVVSIDNIKITLPSTISAAFDIYIKNMRFSYDPTITISATRDGNDMDLTWTSDVAATSYDVYRNGILVADNITEASYEDTVINDGDCVTYKIEAYNGATKVVENEKTVVVHPLNQIVSLDIIDANGTYSSTLSGGNSGLKYANSYNYTKGTVVKNTSGIPDGAVKYPVVAKDENGANKVEKIVYEFKGNIQTFPSDAYIAMLLYVEADSNAIVDKPLRVFLTENSTWKKYQPEDFGDLVANQWHYIKVPISELKNAGTPCTGANIYDLQIQFTNPTEATSAYNLYVKDLRIAYDCTIEADNLTPNVGDTVTFTTDSTQGFNFIVAAYDIDRKLISVEFVNEATKAYTVKEGDKYVKAMLWTDMTKLIPVTSDVEVTVQTVQ